MNLKMFKYFYALTAFIICAHAYLLPVPAQALLLRGGTATSLISPYPYVNPCPQVSQNWCVETDGWTTFTPVTSGTGSCGATGTFTGTCVTYIAENGTGTSATCRIAAAPGFVFTTSISDSLACPYTTTSMSLARDNSSDFLLFKKGDCFVDRLVTSPCTGSASLTGASFGICTAAGRGCNFNRNGASRAAPLVIGAYGPLSDPRPAFTTINSSTMNVQAGFGSNLAVLDLEFNGGYLFTDYRNSTYNPGFITATATAASGQNQIVMPSPPPSNLINNTNALDWAIYNFSNPAEMQGQTTCGSGMRLNSISGNTLTLLSNIPTGWNIAVGDTLVYMPLKCGNGDLTFGLNVLNFGYVEGMLVKGAAINVNPQTQPQLTEFYLRRNVIHDSASVNTRNQGIFIGNTHNTASFVLVEENLTDHTGWRQYDSDCTPGQFLPAKCNGVASTMFYNFQGNPNNQSQGVYDHEDWGNGNFLRNIFVNGAGSSIQVRGGGALYNNFMAQSDTLGTGGAIMVPNVGSYNVFSNSTLSWQAILTVTGVAGNVLSFAHVPQSLESLTGINRCQWFNASNPTGISQTTNATFTITPTTVTIAGPAISASPGDTVYCVGIGANFVALGYEISAAQSGETNSINTALPSDIQWNIHTGTLPIAYTGGPIQTGISYSMNTARATGNTFANNWLMNQQSIGIQDQTLISGVGSTVFCGSKVGISTPKGGFWRIGDAITISGTLPTSMNANVSTTVDSIDTSLDPNVLCLSGTTFGTGTWTAGTGVINGGVAWANNHYYNITGALVSSTAAGGTSGAIASLSTFTPVTTTGCPQAANCPSIEGYAITSGLGTTMADFVACAKLNRRGSYDVRCTAAAANDHIRRYTDPSIPRPVMWLLKRDLDPASNDNSPMWLEKAA